MAALRLFTRTNPLPIISRYFDRFQSFNDTLPKVAQVDKRWGTFATSLIYDPEQADKYTDYKVTRDPEEWKYVEALLKPKFVPIPPLENKTYPSGWKPPTAKPGDHPYYISRTRNYQIPVYLDISYRGTRKQTIVRRIQGDIWKLSSELKEFLRKNTDRPIGMRVNELVGEIKFRGDYVSLVKYWMERTGF